MKITLGALINDARGKLGSMVFSIAKSGQNYVREKAAIASNPRSSYQQILRNAMTMLKYQWNDSVSALEKASWEEFAQRSKGLATDEDQGGGKYNLVPRSKPYTGGWQAYIGINMRVIACSGDYDDIRAEPPYGLKPWLPTDLAIVWNAVDDDIDLTWTDPTYSSIAGDVLLRVWLESYEGGAHKQLISCTLMSAGLLTIDYARYALGILGEIQAHPGLYRLQCDAIVGGAAAESGMVSAPSRIFEVIAIHA